MTSVAKIQNILHFPPRMQMVVIFLFLFGAKRLFNLPLVDLTLFSFPYYQAGLLPELCLLLFILLLFLVRWRLYTEVPS